MNSLNLRPAARFRISHLLCALLLFSAITLLLLQGCGMMHSNMPPAQAVTSFAYISNSGSGTISVFAVGMSGSVSMVAGSPFQSGGGAEFMAMDKVHHFLFAANQTGNNISAFSINTGTGGLSPAPGSPFATGATPLGLAVDPQGKFVFVANQSAGSISVFSINASSGALTPVAGSPFTGIANPFGVTVDPAGSLLFVSSFNGVAGTGNTISSFAINGVTGALSPADLALPTSSPAGITAPIGMATDGKFLFVADHMAEAVAPFTIDQGTGALTPPAALPAPASGCGVSCHHNPLRLTVDPSDKFIYWTNVQAGTLSAFSINNGSLQPISEVSTGQHPFGLALTPDGTLLYVVNKADNSVSGFSVNTANGTVAPISGFPLSTGGNAPTDIVIVAKQ